MKNLAVLGNAISIALHLTNTKSIKNWQILNDFANIRSSDFKGKDDRNFMMLNKLVTENNTVIFEEINHIAFSIREICVR